MVGETWTCHTHMNVVAAMGPNKLKRTPLGVSVDSPHAAKVRRVRLRPRADPTQIERGTGPSRGQITCDKQTYRATTRNHVIRGHGGYGNMRWVVSLTKKLNDTTITLFWYVLLYSFLISLLTVLLLVE